MAESKDIGAVDDLRPSETTDSKVMAEMGTVTDNRDSLQRHLGNRQVQLIAIGGAIGTANFVTMSVGLVRGGPAGLLLAFLLYSGVLALVNNSMAEMSVFMPVSGGFVRLAGKWVDESFGFLAGWNFFLFQALDIPFEITALNLALSFWSDNIPVAAVVAACVLIYFVLNAFTIKWYGETEFWLASGKVILILIVYLFTFITMVGGNPKHDAYGFRYWDKPGAFAEYITTGPLGKFEGFLGALWNAAFTVVGPEFISMVSGETKYPRQYLKTAFKTTYLRFAFFFIGSAICIGIVVPYNDPSLVSIVNGTTSGAGTAAASPYVIAMKNLGISVLPSIVNALLVTSILSAGNAYTYYASRSLYSLALEGQAPKILTRCTKAGVPIYALGVTILFPLLAFLNVSSATSKVLTWLINMVTAAQIIDFIVISTTYLFFYRACRAQGVERTSLPYCGWFQPYGAWIGVIFMTTVVFVYGYSVFLPRSWNVADFFTHYTMVIIAPIFYFGWKVVKRTSIVKPEEADLLWDRPIIDAYEATFDEFSPGFWTEILQMFGLRKDRLERRSV